jgi:hypothetical protein
VQITRLSLADTLERATWQPERSGAPLGSPGAPQVVGGIEESS